MMKKAFKQAQADGLFECFLKSTSSFAFLVVTQFFLCNIN